MNSCSSLTTNNASIVYFYEFFKSLSIWTPTTVDQPPPSMLVHLFYGNSMPNIECDEKVKKKQRNAEQKRKITFYYSNYTLISFFPVVLINGLIIVAKKICAISHNIYEEEQDVEKLMIRKESISLGTFEKWTLVRCTRLHFIYDMRMNFRHPE